MKCWTGPTSQSQPRRINRSNESCPHPTSCCTVRQLNSAIMSCPFALTLRLVYSCFSDVLTLTATAPLERVIGTLQSRGRGGATATDGDAWDCARRIVSERGWVSLWRGNGTRVFYSVIGRALSDSLNDFLNDSLLPRLLPRSSDPRHSQRRRRLRRLAVGFVAGFLSVVLLYPLDYAVFRITVDATTTTGTRNVSDCIQRRIQSAGYTSLYRGLGATVAGIVTNRILAFGLYDLLVTRTATTDAKTTSTSSSPTTATDDETRNVDREWWRMFSARLALDVLAGCAAYPLETIARRRQITTVDHDHHDHHHHDDDHLRHLYSGVSFHIAKIVTTNVILAIYNSETLQKFDILRRFMMKVFH